MRDGTVHHLLEEHNRGSAAYPMASDDLRAKFLENSSGTLDSGSQEKLLEAIQRIERLDDASVLVRLATRQPG